jgi:hypothetical protein
LRRENFPVEPLDMYGRVVYGRVVGIRSYREEVVLADIKVYLTAVEWTWVKRQRKGVIREMVQAFMKRYPETMPAKEEK